MRLSAYYINQSNVHIDKLDLFDVV